MLVNGSPINAVAQNFNFIAIRFKDCSHVFIILWLFAIAKEVANHVSQRLRNTVIFIHCTLRNRFRNAAMTSRNIPRKRRRTGQSVRNRPSEINPVRQACGKTCHKTSSQSNKIVIDKTAHFATSTKMENGELESRLQRRQTTSRNLTRRMVHNTHAYIRRLINSMRPICHYELVAWEGHTRNWKMIPKFTVVSHKKWTFLLQNKVPTENKVNYLLVVRTMYIGTEFEVRSFNTTWIRRC